MSGRSASQDKQLANRLKWAGALCCKIALDAQVASPKTTRRGSPSLAMNSWPGICGACVLPSETVTANDSGVRLSFSLIFSGPLRSNS